jgi:catechol 2,3-dioxygenase-like lactoylglutathione lyase family enzyme
MDLNQVTLPSRDVAKGAAFYRQLGFRQIVENLPSYVRFETPSGSSTLSLHLAESFGPSGVVIYFECDDLDAVYARLVAQGVVFDESPTDRAWLWREAMLRDPGGNVLCFYEAGENRKNPPWRLPEGHFEGRSG